MSKFFFLVNFTSWPSLFKLFWCLQVRIQWKDLYFWFCSFQNGQNLRSLDWKQTHSPHLNDHLSHVASGLDHAFLDENMPMIRGNLRPIL
jgi:hypothetical protein